MNFWPPYLGSGVKVTYVDLANYRVEVELALRFWNKNAVGTQFGGSLYSMCDPFFALLLMEALGPDHIVWDKSATIQFKRPGRSRVWARFEIPPARIESIRERLKTEYKLEPVFEVDVCDFEGNVIAQVEKTLYVRRKDSIAKQAVSRQ